MFTKIELNYPEFDLKLEREFGPGINLIEEPNGYGKTTILNTLLSLYSKKYPGLRTLPLGSSKIYTSAKVYMLSKSLWVGLDELPNDLIKFILPGEFFSMDSPKQRATLVKLLDIDFEAYMKEKVPEWTPTIEKELNLRLKENKGREDVILDDIIRFKAIVTQFEKNPVTIVKGNANEIEQKYQEYLSKFNKAKLDIQIKNNQIDATVNRNNIEMFNLSTKINDLRDKFTSLKKECSLCGAPLSQDKIDKILTDINTEGKTLKAALVEVESRKIDTKESVPDEYPVRDLQQKTAFLKIELVEENTSAVQQIVEYEQAKRELKIKEDLLKTLGELKDKETLTFIKKYKNLFTKDLEDKVKELGLEIELFKTKADGELTESFVIMLDGKPYSELSGGNRLLCQIRLSLAFVKKLGLDFILIDEAGLISQKNYDIIEHECKGLQVIMARATPFSANAITAQVEKKPKKKAK